MKETDKVKMTINIGGEYLPISVPFNRQDAVRDAESAVGQLFDAWKLKWPKHSDTRVLAMVAYQFSMAYNDLLSLHKKAVERAEECENLLNLFLDKEKA